MDVKQLEELEDFVKEIVDKTGSLDGSVYCAGITDGRPLAMATLPVVQEVLQTNLQGFIERVRYVSKKNFNPGMRIVGISSTSSLREQGHMLYIVPQKLE